MFIKSNEAGKHVLCRADGKVVEHAIKFILLLSLYCEIIAQIYDCSQVTTIVRKYFIRDVQNSDIILLEHTKLLIRKLRQLRHIKVQWST